MSCYTGVMEVLKCKVPIIMTCGTKDGLFERNEKVLEDLIRDFDMRLKDYK